MKANKINFRQLFLGIMIVFTACNNSDQMILKGRLKGGFKEQLIVRQKVEGLMIETDTIDIGRWGFFRYKKKLEAPDVYYLNYFTENKRKSDLIVFLDNEKIKLKGYYDSLTVCQIEGIKDQHLWDSINGKVTQYEKDIEAIFGMKMMAKEESEKEKLDKQMRSMHARMIKSQQNFVSENLDKPVGSFVLTKVQWDYPLQELENLLLSFDTTIHANATWGYLYKRVLKRKEMLPGNPIPNIQAQTIAGEPIDLYEVAAKNRYTLVDFWASWCFPYTNEVNKIVDLYKTYRKEGFEIVGVSIDIYQPHTKEAISTYNITWPQIFDGKGWQGPIARLYGLNTLPYNYLIDENGVIIANNVRGQELENLLEELLRNQAL